jgi:hypothetical protein
MMPNQGLRLARRPWFFKLIWKNDRYEFALRGLEQILAY